MKLIIAGSRTLCPSKDSLYKYLVNIGIASKITEIISGGAQGVDRSGEELANDADIPLRLFKADWDKHGKSAGPIRNKQMAEYADALLLVWDGNSRGSASMKKEMEKLNKLIFEIIN